MSHLSTVGSKLYWHEQISTLQPIKIRKKIVSSTVRRLTVYSCMYTWPFQIQVSFLKRFFFLSEATHAQSFCCGLLCVLLSSSSSSRQFIEQSWFAQVHIPTRPCKPRLEFLGDIIFHLPNPNKQRDILEGNSAYLIGVLFHSMIE